MKILRTMSMGLKKTISAKKERLNNYFDSMLLQKTHSIEPAASDNFQVLVAERFDRLEKMVSEIAQRITSIEKD